MPKQIVVVLDASSSMSNHEIRLDILAKNAVKDIIGMLSPTDAVGLVYFSDKAHKPRPGSCLEKKLAMMTSQNKKNLKNDLDEHYNTRNSNTRT